MHRDTISALVAFAILAGCNSSTAGRALVEGAGADDFVRMRAGPGLGYSVILGLPDGTSVDRRDCVTEVGQLWCRVSLAAAPRIVGYVSADYLSAPRPPPAADEHLILRGRSL